jgi:hypothetical protein
LRARISELVPGTCFKQGKTLKKKLSDGRVVSVNPKGKVRIAEPKGDPLVSSTKCDLVMLGLGLRKHPELMVEMGNGKPRHFKDQNLK